ncbi:hypothetical protein GJ496_005435 [Pomphorhynchus laevis]|nr:hypothetical protein GJ496_005435 [Pomphorhynchus laevis]
MQKIKSLLICNSNIAILRRYKQLGSINNALVEIHRKNNVPDDILIKNTNFNDKFRYTHQDFIPNPTQYFRDYLAEKLERKDMIQRRAQIDIPLFYVGSIIAVESADPYAPNKINRFVGICICRSGHGLRHFFILRNVIEGVGIELRFDLYNPCIQKIEVLKLEIRLDQQLFYLRDCPPEYSTVSFDYERESTIERQHKMDDLNICLNSIKVPLNPPPWQRKWHMVEGLRGFTIDDTYLSRAKKEAVRKFSKPWKQFDIMKHYRMQIPDNDVNKIADEYSKSIRTQQITMDAEQKTGRLKRIRKLPDTINTK